MLDLVQTMAGNNPQIERMTIWGYTEEEILHRWKVFLRLNPSNGLFGGIKPSVETADNPAKQTINDSPHAERFLEHLLMEGDDDG